MKIDRIKYKTLSLITGGLLTLSIAGCVNDNSVCIEDQPGYKEGNDVWLSFHVKNMGETGRTRADVPRPEDPVHPDEVASDAENFINTSDISLMFFDDRGSLWKVFQQDEYVIVPVGTDGREYELKFKMNKDYFNYAKGKDNVDYSLMVVANTNGLKNDHDTFDYNLFGQTPGKIAQQYRSFTMPGQTDAPWMPSQADFDLIPMAGIAKNSFPASVLETGNTWETAAEIGDVYMQRCLAKIRVLDAIPLQEDAALEGGGTAKITGVRLVGSNTKGAYIPYFTETNWYDGTAVVETATEKSSDNWFNAEASVVLRNTNAPHTSVTDNKKYPNQFYCYVPESVVTDRNTKLEITVDFGADGSRIFDVPLARPYGDTYTGISNIARNHIYEYIVNATMASLELTLHVNDWDEHETIWDYKDNPTIADGGYLKWNPETTTSNVILSYGNTATGTFRFSDPVGGTWYASLVPEGQTERDAFRFVDKDDAGNDIYVESISGKIGDTSSPNSEIKVRAMLEAGTEQRSARLIFTVKTPDGRTLTADLVDGDDTYFTIVQNAKL